MNNYRIRALEKMAYGALGLNEPVTLDTSSPVATQQPGPSSFVDPASQKKGPGNVAIAHFGDKGMPASPARTWRDFVPTDVVPFQNGGNYPVVGNSKLQWRIPVSDYAAAPYIPSKFRGQYQADLRNMQNRDLNYTGYVAASRQPADYGHQTSYERLGMKPTQIAEPARKYWGKGTPARRQLNPENDPGMNDARVEMMREHVSGDSGRPFKADPAYWDFVDDLKSGRIPDDEALYYQAMLQRNRDKARQAQVAANFGSKAAILASLAEMTPALAVAGPALQSISEGEGPWSSVKSGLLGGARLPFTLGAIGYGRHMFNTRLRGQGLGGIFNNIKKDFGSPGGWKDFLNESWRNFVPNMLPQ